jgi:Family of unknown function (DUF5985)
MAALSYALCVLSALACAWLLTRAWRRGGARLLFWSALCFWGLSVTNGLVFVDLVVFPEHDLYSLRLGTALVSISVLVFGLVWESR